MKGKIASSKIHWACVNNLLIKILFIFMYSKEITWLFCTKDPDLSFYWNLIEEVNKFSSFFNSCQFLFTEKICNIPIYKLALGAHDETECKVWLVKWLNIFTSLIDLKQQVKNTHNMRIDIHISPQVIHVMQVNHFVY